MQKIYFDRLHWKNPWGVIPALALFLILLFSMGKAYWRWETKELNLFLLSALTLLVIYFSRLFWYKNVIQWNKKGFVIRIKPYRHIGKTLPFRSIKAVEKMGTVLCLKLTKDKMITFDLCHIRAEDQERLFYLLTDHCYSSK